MDTMMPHCHSSTACLQAMTTTFRTLLFAATAWLTSAAPAAAYTLFWGGANEDLLYTSYGSLLDDSFRFELGTFSPGFSPDASNISDWRANWKLFDAAVIGDGWNSAAGFVSSSATLTETGNSTSPYALPGSVFNLGDRAYIWVYNRLDGLEGTEWALLTGISSPNISTNSNWVMPSPSDQTTGDLQWRFDTGSTPVLGGLNDDRGPGTYTNDPPAYQLQTSAIPEPGSAMLIGSVGLLVHLRRRRS